MLMPAKCSSTSYPVFHNSTALSLNHNTMKPPSPYIKTDRARSSCLQSAAHMHLFALFFIDSRTVLLLDHDTFMISNYVRVLNNPHNVQIIMKRMFNYLMS